VVLGFELMATCLLGRLSYCLTHSASPFFVIFFFCRCFVFSEKGSQELFAQGWLWTLILLISASWEARIIGMSHWCPASYFSNRGLCLLPGQPRLWCSRSQPPKQFGLTDVPPCPAISWDGVLITFCPGWPWTTIFLISASQVARRQVAGRREPPPAAF
jgi:hypothetical protein